MMILNSDGTNLVTNLVHSLTGALTYPDLGNVETNKRLWNRYADEWNAQKEVGMHAHT